jgi:hypothetical protein
MAINKTLPELFGVGAAQTLTDFTVAKASLSSSRTPAAFQALLALAENTAESLLIALILRAWENQDTSPDAQLAIFGPDVQLVSMVSDGVSAVFEQYVFSVRILTKKSQAMPNPNLI